MHDVAPAERILVVDDDPVNRKILSSLLIKHGYAVFLAENGRQAIDAFHSAKPDFILMDIIMPEMNGYEAAKVIKQQCEEKNKFVPIIFLTAVTEEAALHRCVESGGDDFLTKPFNGVILKAKINALRRIRTLYNTLNSNKQELEHYRASIEHELEFADHILANITAKAFIDLDYVKRWSTSLSVSDFSGDLFFVARKPTGGLHLMLCDFSGHGLPAAVGALPVSEIFVAMTSRGFSMYDILLEVNKKLSNELPTGFFCAAVFIEIDCTQGVMSIINAGLPDCFLVDSEQGELRPIKSSQFPLGIVIDGLSKDGIEVVEIKPGLKLLMYSDGLSELENATRQQFGVSGVRESIVAARPGVSYIDSIKGHVERFCDGLSARDDLTVIEIDCYAASRDNEAEQRSVRQLPSIPAEWKVEFDLSIGVLKTTNPVPLIVNVIANLSISPNHRKRIFTIISELYNNALDHGLLGLNSELKNSPDGFMRYHQEKLARLNELKDGWAKIRVEHVLENEVFVININVSDSGPGFDCSVFPGECVIAESRLPSGRGIHLVRSMADKMEYREGGRVAHVRYLIKDADVKEG